MKKSRSFSLDKYGDAYPMVHALFAFRNDRMKEIRRLQALVAKNHTHVCKLWIQEPLVFLTWRSEEAARLGEKNPESLRMRRRDISKPYSPSNCFLVKKND